VKTIVWKFGLTSGFILAAMAAVMMPLCMSGVLDFSNAALVGYAAMVLSFLAVFFGIQTYRDTAGGGAITFGRAFKVGILIALVSCTVYVIGWEIVYWGFIPDFGEKYAAFQLEKLRADGAAPEKLAAMRKELEHFQVMYRKPLYNVGITFLEVFPVGVIVTLISAAILRRKPAGPLTASA
jgi:hypothetical protein